MRVSLIGLWVLLLPLSAAGQATSEQALNDRQLNPRRLDALVRPDVLLGQNKPCPTCLPTEPQSRHTAQRIGALARVEYPGRRRAIRQLPRRGSNSEIRGPSGQGLLCPWPVCRGLDGASRSEVARFLDNCTATVGEVDSALSSIAAEVRTFAVLTARNDTIPVCSALLLDAHTAVTVAIAFGPRSPAISFSARSDGRSNPSSSRSLRTRFRCGHKAWTIRRCSWP